MSVFSAIDHARMAEALRLAARGLYTTQPNPRVGCVIDRDGEVVGRGFHERAGQPHAEVFALREAGERARGATAYVTLEPCAHQGRTGPCADALVAAGVARVVAAVGDPFDRVDGAGFERLRAAGIAVEVGLMAAAALELNIGFFSRVQRGRPFVRVKLAATLDGRTAPAEGTQHWITGEAARRDGHRWRARASAVLTGVDTVIADDPRLDVRLDVVHVAPLRIVVDSALRMPASARMLREGGAAVWVACLDDADAQRRRDLEVAGARVVTLPGRAGRVDLPALLAWLAREHQVNELHVESGATLAAALLRDDLVDELLLYQSETLLGSEARPLFADASPSSWRVFDERRVGVDRRLLLRLHRED
jgi:diaminohydroxyphosphoribosylaminopyrimidine deaminase / 5-amino-6-(5-phosphoribosylamino)uracil reductase